ncbi:hypothetical protein [Bradyrhizobium sp. USDA 4451]
MIHPATAHGKSRPWCDGEVGADVGMRGETKIDPGERDVAMFSTVTLLFLISSLTCAAVVFIADPRQVKRLRA